MECLDYCTLKWCLVNLNFDWWRKIKEGQSSQHWSVADPEIYINGGPLAA